MKIKIYTDGGARNNPGPGAIGVLLCDENDREVIRHKDYIGEATNNIAEYCALIAGLALAVEYKPSDLSCFLDSELVVNQLNGIYKVKNERMKVLYQEVKKQSRLFSHISYSYIPRNHPKMKIADRLVNEALDEAQKGNGS
ncbi:MAG: ribonuclease HI family protein [Candidatus Omnitrophica bacterium]|nr:ribonuclease HI family protein [Candidatus Omnitrophota bacterium]